MTRKNELFFWWAWFFRAVYGVMLMWISFESIYYQCTIKARYPSSSTQWYRLLDWHFFVFCPQKIYQTIYSCRTVVSCLWVVFFSWVLFYCNWHTIGFCVLEKRANRYLVPHPALFEAVTYYHYFSSSKCIFYLEPC